MAVQAQQTGPQGQTGTVQRTEFDKTVRGQMVKAEALPEPVQALARRGGAVDSDGYIRDWRKYFAAADSTDNNRNRNSVWEKDGEGRPTQAAAMLDAARHGPLAAATPPPGRNVRGVDRVPDVHRPGGTETGIASYYTDDQGTKQANGERYLPLTDKKHGHISGGIDRVEHVTDYQHPKGERPAGLTDTSEIFVVAHKTLPMGTMLKIEMLDAQGRPTGEPRWGRVGDRGPYNSRILDFSRAGAKAAGIYGDRGVGAVRITNTGFSVEGSVRKWMDPEEARRRGMR